MARDLRDRTTIQRRIDKEEQRFKLKGFIQTGRWTWNQNAVADMNRLRTLHIVGVQLLQRNKYCGVDK